MSAAPRNEECPNLIDLDTGDEYEWILEPTGAEEPEPGYAHVADHDFAWQREHLERHNHRLADVGDVDPDELARLRALWLAGGAR